MALMNGPFEWYSITADALLRLWQSFLMIVPKFLGGLLVFVLGWVFASGVGRIVVEILGRLKFNEIFERTGWGGAFRRAELKVNISEFLGAIVKWILVFVFLLAAVEILGFLQFAVFLTQVLAFLPNVIVAALIFVVATILADIAQKITVASVERAGVGYAKIAGFLVRWAILGFSVLAILVQLGIASELILTLFRGVVALLAISCGLAFGLGGKDIASESLRELKGRLK